MPTGEHSHFLIEIQVVSGKIKVNNNGYNVINSTL